MAGFTDTFKSIPTKGIGAPIMLIIILAMIMVPLPPFLLDVFFSFNIALSIVILMVSIYAQRPLDFGVFPTVLLVTTLLRLAMNIASTRVVLLEGHKGGDAAGQVIEAFGNFVIGGNYAIGIVIFSILVIINFVVVTKGAGRVSEVSARFTLDAMPGKQMAIDADLNSGLISQEDAQQRRDDISREAEFYGAMDGASKFVRGDAVAGILILFINVIGGLFIGMLMHDLTFAIALEKYVLLTIGDGLVAQLPSLLLSVSTAIIVTRVKSSEEFGDQVHRQLLGDPRAIGVAAFIFLILGLIPGMPNMMFLAFAAILGTATYHLFKNDSGGGMTAQVVSGVARQMAPGGSSGRALTGGADALPAPGGSDEASPEQKELTWDDVPPVDAIGLEVGYRLIPLVDKNQGGILMSRIKGVRKKLSQELGFLLPPIHLRDNLDLPPNSYQVAIMGVTVGEAEIFPDREMAINPGRVFGDLDGIKGMDPAFGLESVWIDPSQKEQAQTLGYTVVDPGTVVATHLSQVLMTQANELLGYEEVQQLLDQLAKTAPKLVEDLVPKTISLGILVKVLQNLLEDGVTIRDMRRIAETLAEHALATQDAGILTTTVRAALGKSIVQNIAGTELELPVITLDPNLEQILHQALQAGGNDAGGFEPGLAERMLQSLTDAAQRQEMTGQPVILLVSAPIRPWLARFVRHSIPGMQVLAYTEIPDNKQIKVIANIGQNG